MWISDPLEERVFKTSIFKILPFVGDEWLKAKYATLNEIVAYQIGSLAGISLPQARCFLSRSPIRICGSDIPEGSPVLLTKDINPNGRCSEILDAPCSNQMKALYLAFATFDRGHEFPEIHIRDSTCFLLDLESQFALFPLIASEADSVLMEYDQRSVTAISDCYEKAKEGGLIDEFTNASKELVGLIESRSWVDSETPTHLAGKYKFIVESIEIRTKCLKTFL